MENNKYCFKSLCKSLILFIVMAFLLYGCKYRSISFDSPQRYNEIFNLPETVLNDGLSIFPDSIDHLETVFFRCDHATNLPLGSSIQIELSIKYDPEDFETEKQAIVGKCSSSIVCGENVYFNRPAYAVAWNWEGCFEYAVLNTDDGIISYVYLQSVDPKDLFIGQDVTPLRYEYLYDVENEMERFFAEGKRASD